ncbi:MAG: hypothetical protein VX335_02420 [Pseudomonadota bacterium]|nr:hypothetical protein [Pseudomonadota bacterium]
MKEVFRIEYNLVHNLEKSLAAASFRKGISAFRYGLVTSGISDHLPISAKIFLNDESLNIFSWNLLSDDHTFNSFMNVTGTKLLINDLRKSQHSEDIGISLSKIKQNYYQGLTDPIELNYYDGMNIKFFFSELAQFLYKNKKTTTDDSDGQTLYEIELNDDLINSFLTEQGSVKLKKGASKEEVNLLVEERKYILDVLLDKNNTNNFEYDLAIKHSLEIIFHLKEGSFDFSNRLMRMKEQPELISSLQHQDIMCFQECTNPELLCAFLNENINKNIAYVSHSLRSDNQDHVVIAYDSSKFNLADVDIIKAAFGNRKPYIIATLQHIKTKENIICGSIHHPGGKENLVAELEECVSKIQDKIGDTAYFIMGDYNHTKEFFNNPYLMFPKHGTFTANDYDNYSKSIDGILTNKEVEFTEKVNLLTDAVPINIHITDLKHGVIQVSAPKSFRQKVASDNTKLVLARSFNVVGQNRSTRD